MTFAVMSDEKKAHLVELEELRLEVGGTQVIADPLQLIRTVRVPVKVVIGEGSIQVSQLESLRAGSVLALDRDLNAPVDLVVEGQVIAKGVIVAVGDKFGIQLTELGPKKDA